MSVLNAGLGKSYQSEMNGRVNPALTLSGDEVSENESVGSNGGRVPPPYNAKPPAHNTTNF